MSQWPLKPLGEICRQDRRPVAPNSAEASALPFVGLEHIAADIGEILPNGGSRIGEGKSISFRFDSRHVLYGKLRPYLNKVALPDFEGRCSTELIPLLPSPDTDRGFVAALLRRRQTIQAVMAANTGARMPRADMNVLLSLPVPLPPIAEQRRIVDILSRANGIRRLRHETLVKARQLIPALFVDMFGDPEAARNSSKLHDIVLEFRYGTSQKSSNTGRPALRIPNVVGGSIDLADLKTVAVTEKEYQRLKLEEGDLLFVRTNGNPDYVGRSAVFDSSVVAGSGFEPSQFIYASYLIRARPDPRRVNSIYLQALLASEFGRKALRERSRTSAGQYNINTVALGSVPIPLAPIDLQRAFAARVADIQSIIVQQERAAAVAERLMQSLMARCFEG